LAEFTRERKIGLIFVNLPLTREYLDPTRLKYEQEFKAFMAQSAQGMGFTFLDFSQSELSMNGYFSDPSHLNRYGGYAVSGKLVKALPWQNLLSNPNFRVPVLTAVTKVDTCFHQFLHGRDLCHRMFPFFHDVSEAPLGFCRGEDALWLLTSERLQ